MSGRRARCPGLPETPDVWAVGASFCAPWTPVPDVRDFGRISGGGRMSGLDAGCPGPVGLGVWAAAAVVALGAGCPGPGR